MMSKLFGRLLVGVFAAGLVLGAESAQGGPIYFDFTGAEGGTKGISGAPGNTRTFTSGDVTLWVTSWGYTYGELNDGLEAARLGRWSTGLGSCNVEEIPCADPNHQVDNVGAEDWIFFVFSQPVDITSVKIDPFGTYDRDVSYYLGTVSVPLDLTGIDYSGLSALGFGSLYSDSATESGAHRDVQIAGGWANALLFGGYQGSDEDDYFKIRSLSAVQVPEPGSFSLFLLGTAALAGVRSRRSKRAV